MTNEAKNRRSLFAPLDEYHRQFESLIAEGQELLSGLNANQFNWAPEPGVWSVGECVDHLNEVAVMYAAEFEEALPKLRHRGLEGDTGRYGFLERLFIRQMEPPPKRRFRAPKRMRPASKLDPEATLKRFEDLRQKILRLIWEYNGLDLARAKIRNPLFRFVKMSAGAALAGVAAHERRHFWQIRQRLAEPGFPTSSTSP